MNHIFRIVLLSIISLLNIHFTYTQANKPVVLVIGTRPEGIKMIPVYLALKELHIPTILCSTGQHTEILEDIFTLFHVEPDIRLNIMKPGQDLFHITTAVLAKMKEVLSEYDPCMVLVQGDTTSAMAAALASFYLKIPVGHVEAGLRTGNKYGPFPEEINRRLIGSLATYHFAPTADALANLRKEDININVYNTGNTVVDALHLIQNKIHNHELAVSSELVKLIREQQKIGRKIMLLTAHRRESFNGGLHHIFNAIKQALADHPELFIIYPMHPNPCVKEAVEQTQLRSCSDIFVTSPLSYADLVYVLEHSNFIATDSGGIQEEANSLGKQVIVLRNETDRMEGVKAGCSYLAGTDEEQIRSLINNLLENNQHRSANNLYGIGTAGRQIASIIKHAFYA